MKSVFFASDSYALTGPSIVNKYYRELLGQEFTFSEKENVFFMRLIRSVINVLKHRVLIISGASKLDYLLIYIAKIFRRKIIYIMHGCIQEENRINKVEREDETRLENFYLETADLVLCVSEQFSCWVKEKYPMYRDKIFTLTNGVDWRIIEKHSEVGNQNKKTISIIGGGVPRKNVKSVCEAISQLNKDACEKYQLKVFGRDDIDTEKIKSYPFVQYYGKVDRAILFREIASTTLFIQNSVFDSFAMAPLEALVCGCSVLCSKNVGALSLFNNLESTDIIEDCFDVEEIKEKVIYLLSTPNHDRLLNGLDELETSFEHRADELRKYTYQLIGGIEGE